MPVGLSPILRMCMMPVTRSILTINRRFKGLPLMPTAHTQLKRETGPWKPYYAIFCMGVFLLVSGCGEVDHTSPNTQRETLPTQASILGHWEVTVIVDEEATRAFLREEGLPREQVGSELIGLQQELSQTRLTVVFHPDGTLSTQTKTADGKETKQTERWEVLEGAAHSLTLKITQPEVERKVKVRFLNPDQFQIVENPASLVQVLTFKRQTGKVTFW